MSHDDPVTFCLPDNPGNDSSSCSGNPAVVAYALSIASQNKVTDATDVPGEIRYRFQKLSKDQSPFELANSLTISSHDSPL